MLSTLSGIVTLVRPLQPENTEDPMLVTPSEITTFVIARYDDWKTDDNLLVQTYCGIVTLVNLLQPENAEDPILSTLSGIVTLASSLQL